MLLPYQATFPALGTRAVLLTSHPETLLPAVQIVRDELDVFDLEGDANGVVEALLAGILADTKSTLANQRKSELEARTRAAQVVADQLAERLPGGFLLDLGGSPAVAGESLAAPQMAA